MQRRNFIKGTAAAAILGTGGYKTLAKGIIQESKKKDLLIPARLKPGDTIGLVAPGSFITENELKESVQNLEELGFKVAYSKNILARSGYLGGTDKQRADDVNNMFERKDINGIFCARGGYGCARILPILDYGKIEKNPKVIIGYSDITALLYGIYSQTGLVCYHGPVGISTFNEFSVYNMENVLMQPSASFAMISKPDKEDDELYKIYPIRSGIAKGELVGGNLSIVVSLIGTKYDIDTTGKIVFLEDVGEEPYRIDRMLTQMIEAGKFDNAAGIALGVFKHCRVKKENPSFKTSFNLREVLFDRLYKLGVPVIYGLSFGHIENKFTLPFGIKAKLDVTNQTLTLLEKAVL
ncbi:putative murein peptide carboxypeptidase [bacterium BMS3Abin04]|nr:putative murein peptide carboxypeptidase [bacterium BMS3Abin04]